MSRHARLDGHRFVPDPGESILQAARRLGVYVPSLCHQDGLRPDGGCRLCLVEVQGRPRPVAACHTTVSADMEILTRTERLEQLRRGVLDLWLDSLPEGALAAEDLSPELAALATRAGRRIPTRGAPPAEPVSADAHPYLRFDPARCLVCRRCLDTCAEVQGQGVYAVEGRGAEVALAFGADTDFSTSECTACGACVDVCPTGALWDRDRDGATERSVATTCAYCGVGCGVDVEVAHDRVLRIRGTPSSPVNRGHLCAKGRFAHGYHHAPDRLTRPLLRQADGSQREVSWEEATRWLADRLLAIRDRHGPSALGAFSSSRSTNEAAYLLQKLFRGTLGTNHVDCCARVCHSSTALALQRVTGTGAASASYEDLESAGCIVVAGANPTEAHPVIGARIRRAAAHGVPLLVIDPRRIELVDDATCHVALRPGTNVALLNALAKALLEEGGLDEAYLEERVEGLPELRSHLAEISIEHCAGLCGVSPETIRQAARLLAHSKPVLFVHGLGLSELTQGTASVMALCNLGMLTGSIGRPGAGMLPLRGQNNVQGNADMGGMPNLVTGYQALEAPEVRARLEALWGHAPPTEGGLTIPEMLDAACSGDVRALWIQGEDVVQSDPNEAHVRAAMERLELLVVQELFPSQTASYAHLVLPAAGALEQDGTFTNGERRVQRVRAAVPPPGEARPDWEAVRDVARALGEDWPYEQASEVWDEIARVAPHLFGGISYARLEAGGIQWPCPAPDHPGTGTVHASGFLRGRGKLACVDYVPSPEETDQEHPYILVTGRVLQHYNVGSMTRRTPNRELIPEDVLEVHPDDAAHEALPDGARAELASRWGSTCVRVAHSTRVTPGTLFLSFHYPETHANRVTGPHLDPDSKCPEYKVTAVHLALAP